MDLAQYYTMDSVSDNLVSQFKNTCPENVIDIGCGELSLLLAAKKRWDQAKLIGFDIDPRSVSKKPEGNISLSLGDGLDPDLSEKIKEVYGEIDVAISNPPYLSVDRNKTVDEILIGAGMQDVLSKNLKKVPAELIFMAQNMRVMKKESEIGIILPSGMISGERWKGFREYILSEFLVKACIELPPNAFKKTEVSTFALCLEKGSGRTGNIDLRVLNAKDSIEISNESAIRRMDFSYYKSSKILDRFGFSQIASDEVFRGNLSRAALEKRKIPYLHSTSLENTPREISLPDTVICSSVRSAQAGDIVIVRVGTRCLGRAAYIKSGCSAITDCIFVIRSKDNSEIWKRLVKLEFSKGLSEVALGAGAKYITLTILKEILNGK